MKFKEKVSGGKNFLRLKSGESVRGVFIGEPHEFKQHWINKKGVLCKGEGCELCKEGPKSKFRFRINLIINENGAYVSKIFEQGYTVYDALRSLNEEWPLEDHLVKITRNGSGTDTSYAVVPQAQGKLSEERKKQIQDVKLHDLEGLKASEPELENDANEDIGF